MKGERDTPWPRGNDSRFTLPSGHPLAETHSPHSIHEAGRARTGPQPAGSSGLPPELQLTMGSCASDERRHLEFRVLRTENHHMPLAPQNHLLLSPRRPPEMPLSSSQPNAQPRDPGHLRPRGWRGEGMGEEDMATCPRGRHGASHGQKLVQAGASSSTGANTEPGADGGGPCLAAASMCSSRASFNFRKYISHTFLSHLIIRSFGVTAPRLAREEHGIRRLLGRRQTGDKGRFSGRASHAGRCRVAGGRDSLPVSQSSLTVPHGAGETNLLTTWNGMD